MRRFIRVRLHILLVSLLLGCIPAVARAGETEDPRTQWQYRRFNWLDATLSVVGVTVIAVSALLPPAEDPKWMGGVLFDDAIREALRAESRAGRDRARSVGDFTYRFSALAPTVIDGLMVSLWLNDAPDVTGQMLLINLQSYALAGAVLTGSERAFARARPSADPCVSDPEYERFCGNDDRNNSFISGHTGVAAISAGLLCVHHQYLGLYGNPWADAAACGAGVGLALTTGIARLVNDRHYATDSLAAFGVGALGGYVLPALSFYAIRSDTPPMMFSSWSTRHALGVTASGLF